MSTGKSSFYKMTTSSIDIDDNNFDEENNDDEQAPLNSQPLDERILDIIRNTKKDNHDGHRTIRPALLANSLGLSVEEATRELCGLLSAVGGGEDGASFVFERVDMPGEDDDAAKSSSSFNATTTMVFTFPHDFDKRAKRYRRNSDMKQRVQTFSVGLIKAVKVFTAFGLIISLAVLIIAGICLLVAAVIALARGGHGNGGSSRNHPLMHRLRYLFFQLRQILWLYAICGSNGQNGDPFMREVAGDLAFMMSMFCGNPMHPFFWFRIGGMRQRWARVRRTRGWGNTDGSNMDGIAMMRRGTWGDENYDDDNCSLYNQRSSSSSFNSEQQQRGLLSIAVEFLFGPSDNSSHPSTGTNRNLLSSKELQKWKYRVSVIITLSTSHSEDSGISLRELLPHVDFPPASAEDPAAIRETLKIVSYFNGRPVAASGNEANSGIDAKFCFPEIIAEMDCQNLLTMGRSEFAPPTFESESNISSILYKEEEVNDFGSSDNASNDMASEYLYEQPFVLTELSRQQFGQCVMLGLLNFFGVIWIHNALMPGGLLQLPLSTSSSRSKPLLAFASILVLKMFKILSFYSKIFLLLPLCRLVIVLIRNYLVERRNKRRRNFVRT